MYISVRWTSLGLILLSFFPASPLKYFKFLYLVFLIFLYHMKRIWNKVWILIKVDHA